MNLVDVALILIVLLGAWGGWGRGAIVAGLQLGALAASLLFALWGYRHAAAWANGSEAGHSPWLLPLSFLATFVVARLVLAAGSHRIVRAVPQRVHEHRANRALGTLPGFVNGTVNAMVLALIVLAVPLFDGLSAAARESRLASRLAVPAEWLEARLAPIFDTAVQRSLQRMTVPPESNAFIRLPYQVASPKPRPDLEARLLEMVNEERTRMGLRPLRADPELAEVARAHSRDMFARGYFSHHTPEGLTPFDRMRRADVRFLAAGENLALAQTLHSAHQGLMNSPGHRANILRPQFGRLGVAVLDGGMYGLMVTQKFRN